MANKALLPAALTKELRALVPAVARHAREVLAAEIPAYASDARGPDGDAMVEGAILVAVQGLLSITARPRTPVTASLDPATVEVAYDFGRFEAEHGRTTDALLGAYRVGARVAWRDLSRVMIDRGVSADAVAGVAEVVFDYIDQLSAASIAGHGDELASVGRAREQHVERLIRRLLDHAPADELASLADTAGWAPPQTLTAVVLPAAQARAALQYLDHRTLLAPSDVVTGAAEHTAVLLVPDVHRDRDAVLRALRNQGCVVGPARPWTAVAASHQRAQRAGELLGALGSGDHPVDTDAHLAQLIVGGDEETLADLRARVLAPLAALRPTTAGRLAETLRSWLLHQGRRDEVAADLDVHPQTIRYRMGQLRNLFGDQLTTTNGVLDLVVALATLPTGPDDEVAPTE